jgi:hypothetical protein
MMWLEREGREKDVRVTVDATNHDDLLGKVREKGYYAYHFGVCWALPQNSASPYVNFNELCYPSSISKSRKSQSLPDYGVPIVALTSLTDCGIQPKDVKKLFHANPYFIAAEDFVLLYDDARVVSIKTEPEDDLRVLLTQDLRENTVVRVDHYEEVLHHVRSMDCDLGWAAAWFGYRKHIMARQLTLGGERYLRRVNIFVRKNETWTQPHNDPQQRLIQAFYIIFKLFYSEPEFYRPMFGLETGPVDPSHLHSQHAVHDWIMSPKTLQEIDIRLKDGVEYQ